MNFYFFRTVETTEILVGGCKKIGLTPYKKQSKHGTGEQKMALKIVEVNPSIRKNVEASNGYCPCAIWQNEDTKCMCKEFREQKEAGKCHCGRFEKVVAEDGK